MKVMTSKKVFYKCRMDNKYNEKGYREWTEENLETVKTDINYWFQHGYINPTVSKVELEQVKDIVEN